MIDIEKMKGIITICEKEYTKAEHIYFEKGMRLDLARAEYQKVCPHENKEERKFTVEGTYLERSEYITDIYCKDCGMFIKRFSKAGGYG